MRTGPLHGDLRAVVTLRNVRPWGGEVSDIHIADGLITAVSPAAIRATDAAPLSDGEIDGKGQLALPGLVNAHAHLDKSWWGQPWQPYGGEGGVEGRIRWERERRAAIGVPGVEPTAKVLAEFVRHGTTAIRSHVDVDLGIGLRGIEVVREAVAAYQGALTVEIVAFPQDGVLRRPGVLDLLGQAAREGAEHVGGLDPASIDRDPVGQIDAIFALGAEHGVGIDIHLHDPGELGAFQIELVIDRTQRFGLAGRVTVSHGFAIAQVDAARRSDLLQAMAALDITMATVAPLRLQQLPLHDLDQRGVPLAFGTDGIRDLWSPHGTGDLLGIAWQYARASGLSSDDDLLRVVQLATRDGGPYVGLSHHDLVAGARADIVVIDAENPMDALVRMPPRSVVIGGGRLLHQS